MKKPEAVKLLLKRRMRFLIRSADFKDRKGLLALARCFPLCSLPARLSAIDQKIQTSQASFQKILPKEGRNYLFVLEDRKKKQIIGSSQILSCFGPNRSLCYFLKNEKKGAYLKLERAKKGRHQIGGLILHPDCRKSADLLGPQIGLARFLYIKAFFRDFSPVIEVSLTAPIDGASNHFWKETGAKCLKMDYRSALKSFQKSRPQFFSLFPKNLKIDFRRLSYKAKSYMERVHPQTFPVYSGLLKRGFYKTNCFHVLDGGIYMEARWRELSFLKRAKARVLKKGKVIKASAFLLCQQTERGFFCAHGKGEIKKQDLLVSRFPKEFEEGKKALAAPFP